MKRRLYVLSIVLVRPSPTIVIAGSLQEESMAIRTKTYDQGIDRTFQKWMGRVRFGYFHNSKVRWHISAHRTDKNSQLPFTIGSYQDLRSPTPPKKRNQLHGTLT